MPLLDNLICYSGFGMIESMLEPHMKTTISASQMQVGVAFLISGGVYMVANPPIGKVKINFAKKTRLFTISFRFVI